MTISTKHTRLFLLLGAVALAPGCANRTETVKADAESPRPIQRVAADLDAYEVSSVVFQPNQTGLSPRAEDQLKFAIDQAKRRGDVKEIKVAVWSDAAYPSDDEVLPKRQVNLAQKRGDNVEKSLKKKVSADVDVHNMAEQPTSLAKYLETDDATVKQKLATVSEVPSSRTSSALVFIRLR